MTALIGVDFGTTNSVLALAQPDGQVRSQRINLQVRSQRIDAAGESLDVFRSVLCFWSDQGRGGASLRHAAGPDAVQAYLDDPLDSRLILSMKTYLAQRSFSQTRIFSRMFTLPELVALFLRALLADAPAAARIVVGRPVRFAGESADDDFGTERLRQAFAQAGFPAIDIALEPEAAGYRVARTLDRPAVVLVGDFGGGTSDFSVMRFAPTGPTRVTALGHAGIGIAGDTFDYRIIDHVISPRLGKGDVYTVMGKELPVPPEYFSAFARWHRLSMMRAPRTLRDIQAVAAASAHPERLRALIRLIEDEMGYPLYQSVNDLKARLSGQDSATLRFAHRDLVIEREVTRPEFETWIADDLSRIAATVDQALRNADVTAQAVDRVFLTGGTSFVPAVRALFEARFGAEKVSGGGEFVSVAEGLALIARDRAAGS